MTGNSKLYFDDNFSAETTKYYTLLIQIRNTDFSFAVVHQSTLLVWGKNYPLVELASPNELAPYLNPTDYHKVVIGVTPTVFNIVPTKVFNEERVTDFMRVLDVQPSDKAYSQTLDSDNLVLFKDNDQLLPVLTTRYPYHQIVFNYKCWLQTISADNLDSINLYVDIQPNEVHFASYKNNKLRFYNSFNYAGADELAYFTALVANDLQLNQLTTHLIVSGDITTGDSKLANISEFFPKIDISQLKQLEQLPEGVEPQQLLSLTALLLCA
ncbi:DUF3822 family protein [Mucilaginibacter agri]|uniref:DUF3822 family protein n=1 Tax=Mucilaginibacter agri TaxID=2695265 RepID=A0A966DSY1_9SPHI|nr:DUF3822 family protein [Mucilaginibacter agri]NCD70060.1 DUF3822 family protein [Mucilaginibacter agri]